MLTVQCPLCSQEEHLPLGALLITPVDEDTDPDLAALVGWVCSSCGDLAHAAIGWTMLLTLVTAGATLLVESDTDVGPEKSALPPHPETPTAGPAFTPDDLLELHELLSGDGWFAHLTADHARP
jgi:hypothetical protein